MKRVAHYKTLIFIFLFGLLFNFSILPSTTSFALDLGENQPAFNWNGFYGGLHLGYGWGDADTSLTPLPSAQSFGWLEPETQNPNPKGGLGGAQVGFNHQMGLWVIGAETDFSFTSMDGTKVTSPVIAYGGTPFQFGSSAVSVHQDTEWFGTVRLRGGVTPIPKWLFYVTGGLAYGKVNYSANTHYTYFSTNYDHPTDFSRIKIGWTVGTGAEYAINDRWSIKAEYLYYDLGDESSTADETPPWPISSTNYQIRYNWHTRASTINIGMNYRF